MHMDMATNTCVSTRCGLAGDTRSLATSSLLYFICRNRNPSGSSSTSICSQFSADIMCMGVGASSDDLAWSKCVYSLTPRCWLLSIMPLGIILVYDVRLEAYYYDFLLILRNRSFLRQTHEYKSQILPQKKRVCCTRARIMCPFCLLLILMQFNGSLNLHGKGHYVKIYRCSGMA